MAEKQYPAPCSKCEEVLPRESFNKTGDKRRPECKKCAKDVFERARARKEWKSRRIHHGLKETHLSTWYSWRAMKARCNTPSADGYRLYGGRGIRICEQWNGPNGFANFLTDMGDRPEGMTLERINVNGNYEPSNCKWATNKEQSRNRRNNALATINGKTQTMSDWVVELGLSPATIQARVHQQGMTLEDALLKDTRKGRLVTLDGITLNVSDWARRLKISRNAFYRDYLPSPLRVS